MNNTIFSAACRKDKAMGDYQGKEVQLSPLGEVRKLIITKKYLLLLVIVPLFIAACVVKEPINGNDDIISKALKEGMVNNESTEKNKASSLPPSVQRALMPEVSLHDFVGSDESDDESDQRFDVAVTNVAAKDFFMGLVKGTKYNMTVSPEIKGNISLELKAVTIPQVMEAVRDTYGFEYERTSYGYAVFPRRLETRVFHVNYLDIERTGQSQTTIGTGQITSTVQNTLTNTGVSSSQENTSMPSGLIQTKTTSKFWEVMSANLAAIVGSQDGRSVVVDPRSGTILVKAYPDELRKVAYYLDSVQNIIHRQVIIEAKVLEVELKAQYQSGINWKILGAKQGTRSDYNLPLDNETGNIFSSSEVPSEFSSVFSAAASSRGTFSALITLLNDQGKVNVLSSPQVATINNQKAVIKIGDDKFYVTNVSSNTNSNQGGTGSTTSSSVTLTPFFSGISLDVTPQIDEDNNVTLHIHPIISVVTRDRQQFKTNGQDQDLPLAASSTRESDSVVRAKNGQVIVIGGLMQSSGSSYQAGTPGADKLPGVGGLFKNKNNTARKFELVILLRPIVVDGNRAWQKQLNEAMVEAKKMHSMRNKFKYDIVPIKHK